MLLADSSQGTAVQGLSECVTPGACPALSESYGARKNAPTWQATCTSLFSTSNAPGPPMRLSRLWFETIALGSAIACGCALLIAMLAAATAAFTQTAPAQVSPAASAASAAPVESLRTFEGMVTCSKCGAKHSAAIGGTAADCTRQCVHGGASFALVDGERTYTLDGDLAVLKKFAGQRARLSGTLLGNTIRVSTVLAVN